MEDTSNVIIVKKHSMKYFVLVLGLLLLVFGLSVPSKAFASSVHTVGDMALGFQGLGLFDSEHAGFNFDNKKKSSGGSSSGSSSGGSSKKTSSDSSGSNTETKSNSSTSKDKGSSSSTATAAKSYAYLNAMRYRDKDLADEDGSSSEEEGPLFSGNPPVVFDSAGVLSESDIAELEQSCTEISEETGYGVYIALFDGLETDDYDAFTDEYFEGEGYGLCDYNGGILLVVDTAQVDEMMTINNFSSSVLSEDWTDQVIRDVYYQLKVGNYFKACMRYVSMFGQAIDYYIENEEKMYPVDGLQYIYDECGLLNSAEYEDLSSRCKDVTNRTRVAIHVVTVDTIGSETEEDYISRYIDDNGLGLGYSYDCIVLLMIKDTHETSFYYFGDDNAYFSNDDFDTISSAASSADFEDAPKVFVTSCEDVIVLNQEEYSRSTARTTIIVFTMFLAPGVAFGLWYYLKKTHKPKRRKKNELASGNDENFVLTGSEDILCEEKIK